MIENKNLISRLKLNDKDTGSSVVQIFILTKRIIGLTAHLKKHYKDLSTRRGLIHLTNNRKKLISYLKRKDYQQYQFVLNEISLKK